ncbi:MAG: HAMP domain-containing histidine kinase [Coriobacteriia bacterium]|nr:HAMP domain-containing histidine kinase [Coriobacteriia bacterium]
MRLFKWHLVPKDELQKLQALSQHDPHAAAPERSRFNNPDLAALASNYLHTRAVLQAEIRQLQTQLAQQSSNGISSAALATEQADAEAQRTAARLEHMRSDFVAAASHELKTPLAGIEALSDALQMALQDDNPQTAATFAQHITAEIDKMRRLTESLLDLSRFDENPDADSISNLQSSIESAVIMPRRTAATKNIELAVHIDVPQTDAPLAKVSPTDASIILDNLLDNALHYTDTGRIDVQLALSSDEKSWLLVVRDTGIGVAEVDQHRIFDRFFRAECARNHNPAGSGLGLALVKKAVERWQGSIELQSEQGRGSSFTLTLPRA